LQTALRPAGLCTPTTASAALGEWQSLRDLSYVIADLVRPAVVPDTPVLRMQNFRFCMALPDFAYLIAV
jgi:hypothetical protein